MLLDGKIWIASCEKEKVFLLPEMLNRHGVIAGATGTGKTVTLKVLAESLSDMGVPVFISDIKGDLSGMIEKGSDNMDMLRRKERFNLEEEGFSYKSYPVEFWDLFAKKGLQLRTTVSEMGPSLLSVILRLTSIQSDILAVIFKIADDKGLLLIDIKDLKSMISFVREHRKEFSKEYGNISTQSLNAILRSLMVLEEKGGDRFFGEPAIDIKDFFRCDKNNQGIINILNARDVMMECEIYSCFMLYLLSSFLEQLPEVGDTQKPKMVFFFEEAHTLFEIAPDYLRRKIVQMVKLIRSKGIGIFFVTQNPDDIPDDILSQLGNRIQHGLRAYSAKELRKLKSVAESFCPNPELDIKKELINLGTGEALISLLDEEGRPRMVRVCDILPPQSLIGKAATEKMNIVMDSSYLKSKYKASIDRDSAYEFLIRQGKIDEERKDEIIKKEENVMKARKKAVKNIGTTAASTIGRELGGALCENLFENDIGKKLGRNVGSSLGRGLLNTLFCKR